MMIIKSIFRLLLAVVLVSSAVNLNAQKGKTENLVIVTLDGMRWQEVFKGVDTVLMNNSKYNHDPKGMRASFDAADDETKRKKLFPFLWTTIASHGAIYGNRGYGNKMDNANPYWFSYPGYNEIMSGYPDTAVNSNDKIYNKNETVLGFLNKQPAFKGKVAAFSTWDVFPYILNAPASGVYVNADVDTLKFNTPTFQLLNDLQFLAPQPIGVRLDVTTYLAAREYLKTYQPKVLYIAFDETDDFAHGGMYDQYIKAAHAEDGMIADLWKTLQSMPQYKDKTTLVITCDHGRGDANKDQWRDHGTGVPDAHEIWMAVMGPDTPAKGEVKADMQLYQKQLAATFAKLLGFNFTANHPVAAPLDVIWTK